MLKMELRVPEADLTQMSCRFASSYMKDRMKEAGMIEKNVAYNCAAHGYYMGARFTEERVGCPWWQFWKRLPLTSPGLDIESQKAAGYYAKARLQGVPMDQQAVVLVAVAQGFKEGVKNRADQLSSRAS